MTGEDRSYDLRHVLVRSEPPELLARPTAAVIDQNRGKWAAALRPVHPRLERDIPAVDGNLRRIRWRLRMQRGRKDGREEHGGEESKHTNLGGTEGFGPAAIMARPSGWPLDRK